MAAVDIASAADLAALDGRVATNEGTLSAATAAATPSTLAKRDPAGRLQVAGPGAAADAATKKYVDDTTATATATAGDSAATAGTLARRDANGRTQVADPAAAADAASKGYVDGALTSFGRDLGAGTAFPATGPSASALRRGDVYYHSTYGALFLWNGTAWRSRGPGELTAAQRAALVTANIPYAGFQVYETDTSVVQQWTGTAWSVIAGGGFARYAQNAAAGQSFTAGSTNRMLFAVAETAHADITPDATFGTFTLNRAGVWLITTQANIGSTVAGSRYITYIMDGGGANTYATHAQIAGGAASIEEPVSTVRRFAAGDTVGGFLYCQSALSTVPAQGRVNITLTFLRS